MGGFTAIKICKCLLKNHLQTWHYICSCYWVFTTI